MSGRGALQPGLAKQLADITAHLLLACLFCPLCTKTYVSEVCIIANGYKLHLLILNPLEVLFCHTPPPEITLIPECTTPGRVPRGENQTWLPA